MRASNLDSGIWNKLLVAYKVSDGTIVGIYIWRQTTRRAIRGRGDNSDYYFYNYEYEFSVLFSFAEDRQINNYSIINPDFNDEDVYLKFVDLNKDLTLADFSALDSIFDIRSGKRIVGQELNIEGRASPFIVSLEQITSFSMQLTISSTEDFKGSDFDGGSITSSTQVFNLPKEFFSNYQTVSDREVIYTFPNPEGWTMFDDDTNYGIQLRQSDPGFWDTESISEPEIVLGSDTNTLSKIKLDETGREATVTFDEAPVFTDRIRFSIIGPLGNYQFKSQDPTEGNVIVFRRDALDNEIEEIQLGAGQIAPPNINLTVRLKAIESGEPNYGLLPESSYHYAAFYKWVDQVGKEHSSSLSDIKRVNIFGNVGETIEQTISGDTITKTIELEMQFKNLNLTEKRNVSLVILRQKIATAGSETGQTLYRAVKEIPIDSDETSPWIHFTDNVPDRNLFGSFNAGYYSRILQPPGAKAVSIGRRDRVFLGGALGFENSIFFSNPIANQSVDIFSFRTTDSDSGIITMDGKVIGLGNLDTNLLIFTILGVYYLPVDTLAPQFIQESQDNFPLQSEGILEWEQGVTFINRKGIRFVNRGFQIKWLSKNLLDYFLDENIKVVDARASERNSSLRFRLSDGRILIYNTDYSQWTVENYIDGVENEVLGSSYKFNIQNLYRRQPGQDIISQRYKINNNGVLYVTTDDKLNIRKKVHVIETGWLNFSTTAKAALLRDVDIIGDFGDFSDFQIQFYYNFDEREFPKFHKYISPNQDIQNRKQVRVSSRKQKINSVKLKITIKTDTLKLTAVGFLVRKQLFEAAKLGQSSNY